MRICFIGPANSAHIIKWCSWFNSKDYDVHVISFVPSTIDNVSVHLVNLGVNANGGDLRKLKYLTAGKKIRHIVNAIKPDIVSVHYATSYGIAVALSGIKKYVLSVWGSDIYAFPKKSFLHSLLLKYSLHKAPCLFSTSKAMAREASKYTKKTFRITPFGVDMALFNPNKRTRPINDKAFYVGTVKTLADLYGIDVLLHAISTVKKTNREIDLRVKIAGDGPDADKYRKLIKELDIEGITEFLGRISQTNAANVWANLDVAVIPSTTYESFGVSAVEAQASGTPIIVSDVEGLKEATCPGRSSIVVEKKNPQAIADALIMLYNNPKRRFEMGKQGRAYVEKNYEINNTFEHIERLLLGFFESN